MRLPDFEYHSPKSLAELIAVKKELGPAALVLGGGTDLVVRLKQRLTKPDALLSIRDVEELSRISSDPIHLKIGAGATLARVLAEPLVKEEFAGLHQALSRIGHPSCQHHSATLGGNLLLEPRCLYYNQSDFFRKGHDRCFKAGGQVCLVNPESKECASVNQSDGAPMLLAYSAQVKLVSARGERLIQVKELFTGKGELPFTLAEDEILAEIRLPRPVGKVGAAYEKLAARSALDYPLASAAAVAVMEKGLVERVRLVLGQAGPAPVLVDEADSLLRGRSPEPELLDQAARAAQRVCGGMIVDNFGGTEGYRREMVGVLARRALARALA